MVGADVMVGADDGGDELLGKDDDVMVGADDGADVMLGKDD